MSDIRTYLECLGHEKFTIQVLLDQNQEPASLNTKHFKSKKYAQKKYPESKTAKTSAAFKKERLTSAEITQELRAVQKTGRAIWIMVNEGDGKLNLPESPNCVSQSNVRKLTACFIDTDDCPWFEVKEWLDEVELKPHLIVESSPKKYHVYFLLNPTAANDEQIAKWKAVQRSLAHLGNPANTNSGLDQSMHDISKVLRLPGYYHLKGEPWKVRIRKLSKHSKYSLEELFKKTNAKQFLKSENNDSKEKAIYEIPKEKIGKGGRHQAITEYISSRSNYFSGRDLLYSTYGFILRKIEEPESFLDGGNRNNDVRRQVQYYISERRREEEQQSKTTAVEMLDAKVSDPFALSDEFYLNAPGIVGKIVREICSRALYPVPAFTFAAVCAAVGTLKAGTYTTEFGNAPVNYFLCLGPTGSGKDYTQEVLSATFTKLGIGRLLDHRVRSDRGIINFLSSNDSIGMLMLDEGEGFLTSLYDKDSASYLKQCKELLLQLYTSNNYTELNFGHVGNKKEEAPVLRFPRLNVISFGVLHTLDRAFTKVSIKDGLMQRFLVVTHFRERSANPGFKPAKAISAEIMGELGELLNKSRLHREKDLVEVHDLENEIAGCEDDAEKKELEAKLSRFLKERLGRPRTRIKLDDAARVKWLAYRGKMDALYNAEVVKGSGLEGLYTRAGEQVARLSCVLGEESGISEAVIDYCIEFVDSRVSALKSYCSESFDRGELGRDIEELTKFVAAHMNGRGVIMYRDILRGFRVRDSRKLRDLLGDAVESGLLKRVESLRKGGGAGKKGTGYMLGCVID